MDLLHSLDSFANKHVLFSVLRPISIEYMHSYVIGHSPRCSSSRDYLTHNNSPTSTIRTYTILTTISTSLETSLHKTFESYLCVPCRARGSRYDTMFGLR